MLGIDCMAPLRADGTALERIRRFYGATRANEMLFSPRKMIFSDLSGHFRKCVGVPSPAMTARHPRCRNAPHKNLIKYLVLFTIS
jgi:hypothetical protein